MPPEAVTATPSFVGSDDVYSIQSNLLRESMEDVFAKYEIVQVLGEGSMGAVSKVRIRPDLIGGSAYLLSKKKFLRSLMKGWLKPPPILRGGRRHSDHHNNNNRIHDDDDPNDAAAKIAAGQDYVYAMKSIQLNRISPDFVKELQNEIDILRSLDHPNIVRAHEVYTYKKQIYVIMELCSGGDLYTRSPYSERQAALIVNQLLSAVLYMHERGVVHRDLKFENVCFETSDPDAEIKVLDFGLSKKFRTDARTYLMSDRVGTIYTMAPQVLQGVYSSQADVWSVGVMTYMLLSAVRPFYDPKRRRMIDAIMRGSYSMDESTIWSTISSPAKDFVKQLLVVDPRMRLDAVKALDHPWIVERASLPDRLPPIELLESVDGSLVQYRHTSELKKIALNIVAHRSSQKEIVHLRKVFESFDASRNGVLSFDEFQQALKKSNYSDETVAEIFSSLDVNQDGCIMYTEFLAATIEVNGFIEEKRIADAFDRLDSDNTGYISAANLKEILGAGCTPQQVHAIISAVDTDRDGQISFQEFLKAFRTETQHLARRLSRLSSVMTSGQDDSDSDSESLVGLDARIPGGKYDGETGT